MIFSNCEKELSSYAQMLYINCLIYQFDGLEISEKNSHAFKIYETELKVGSIRGKGFIELEKAGLISIEENHVIFNNTWGQYIDRSALINTRLNDSDKIYEKLKKELLKSQSTKDYVLMKYRIEPEKYELLVNDFFAKQIALNKVYADLHDVTKHFYFWVGKNKNNFEGRGKSTTILGM